MLKKATIRC